MTQVLDCTRYNADDHRYPYHQHDCDRCHFCGSFVIVSPEAQAQVKDVWLSTHENEEVLILRHSSSYNDYDSMPTRIIDTLLAAEGAATFFDVQGWRQAREWSKTYYTNVRPFRMNEKLVNDDGSAMVVRAGMLRRKNDPHNEKLVHVVRFGEPADGAELVRRERELLHYYPSTYCTHERDCCGRWYARTARATWLREGQVALVTQSRYCNV